MLIMDESEIKKLALCGQEFIKRPETTDYWDHHVGTLIYDIALSSDENYLYVFYSTGIQKVDRKGKLIWAYSYLSQTGKCVGDVTEEGYVVWAIGPTLSYLKDNGDTCDYLGTVSPNGSVTALTANKISEVYVGLSLSNYNSEIIRHDLLNNKSYDIGTVDNPSGDITSLCLNNNIIIASSENKLVRIYDLNTKESKSIYPFTVSGNTSTVFASSSENKIVCTNGVSGEIVILDTNLNVITRKNTGLGGINSNLVLKDELYINLINPGIITPDIHKFDLNLNELMNKSLGMNPNSKLIYSNKDDALYMAHGNYNVGKFSTFFA